MWQSVRERQQIERLADDASAAGVNGGVQFSLESKRRHRDNADGDRSWMAREYRGRLQSIHPWHLQVHEKYVRFDRAREVDGLLPASRGEGDEPAKLQVVPRKFKPIREVVDDEDAELGRNMRLLHHREGAAWVVLLRSVGERLGTDWVGCSRKLLKTLSTDERRDNGRWQ